MRPLAAIDISVLGTALIYRKHQTGVYRVISELLRQFSARDDVRLEFLSVGRAPWLEFASRLAFARHCRKAGWVFRPRKARLPGSYPLLAAAARAALFAREKGWLSEPLLAGIHQILGMGLRAAPADFSARVYYSPAHALPATPPGVRRCITLYDLIPVKFPQWYVETAGFRKILGSIDGKKDHVIAISACSRADWLAHSGADPALARVVLCGVAEDFFPREDAEGLRRIRAKYGVGEARFILAVGTLEPRKNLETLVRAYLALRQRPGLGDVRLLLAGPKGWLNSTLFQLLAADPEGRDGIGVQGFVPDEDLPWLYSACEAFVFPSLYEGFGLPVAEALKCGAAVVCGDNSSLPEVAGDAAEYADITRPEAVAEALASLLSDRARLQALRAKARARGRGFDWKKAGDAYLEIFASLNAMSP